MFDLVLSVCLAAAPEICVDRRVGFTEPLDRATCMAAGETRAESWAAERPGVRLRGWRCEDASSAPALGIVEIAPGVFVHEGRIATPGPQNAGDVANLAAVIGEDGVAVIDAGGSRAVGEAWLAAIRRVTDGPVRWLILTHMHPDHVLGAEVFREVGAEIIGHGNLEAALEARRRTYLDNYERLLGAGPSAGTRVSGPSHGVAEPQELDIGGRTLRLEPHPTAHTNNDLTVLDSRTGTLFAGDLVFLEHTPALDGSITGWLTVLAKLAQKEGIERVVPGHGPVSAPWPAGAAPTGDYLSALADATREAIAAGEPMSRAIGHLGESQRPGWRLFDEYNPRNATAAYKELEWE